MTQLGPPPAGRCSDLALATVTREPAAVSPFYSRIISEHPTVCDDPPSSGHEFRTVPAGRVDWLHPSRFRTSDRASAPTPAVLPGRRCWTRQCRAAVSGSGGSAPLDEGGGQQLNARAAGPCASSSSGHRGGGACPDGGRSTSRPSPEATAAIVVSTTTEWPRPPSCATTTRGGATGCAATCGSLSAPRRAGWSTGSAGTPPARSSCWRPLPGAGDPVRRRQQLPRMEGPEIRRLVEGTRYLFGHDRRVRAPAAKDRLVRGGGRRAPRDPRDHRGDPRGERPHRP